MSLRDSIYQNLESIIVYKQNVAAAVLALDGLLRENKRELPGDLAHYLENRSYEKAWAWLNEGKQAPRGTCSPKS
ncbi:hypothetical protein H5P28_02325 [Ruficoccus amylovorans]|uniref:Uncharacterized protein n=1 Tax=Ruficoccus amylovorans TaxID=1804625 RepID=A0A842HAH0_9BACT|nr:hypothetical protein [Ruficoccus amylovorans]MBC2593088.1 hypothetical protein [Ruficoccus amylovorans]